MATKTSGSGRRQGGKPAPSVGPATSGPILNGPYDEPQYHCATDFIEITDIDRVKEQLEAEIERVAAEVDGVATPAPIRTFDGPSAWDVFQLLLDMPEDMFEGIRDLRPAEHRPGLIDDDDF